MLRKVKETKTCTVNCQECSEILKIVFLNIKSGTVCLLPFADGSLTWLSWSAPRRFGIVTWTGVYVLKFNWGVTALCFIDYGLISWAKALRLQSLGSKGSHVHDRSYGCLCTGKDSQRMLLYVSVIIARYAILYGCVIVRLVIPGSGNQTRHAH